MPEELVILSGKGGTGKTSITASFAVLAHMAVVADCDVDAADLHLLLDPEVLRTEQFYSGREAIIDRAVCQQCGTCQSYCRFDAVKSELDADGDVVFRVDPVACEGCGVCVRMCPTGAIEFPQSHCGQWMVSRTRCGPMVHARLGVAAENSGKLVTIVRDQARRIANEQHRDLVIVDGPPGIGCPVIASLTGASRVLVVTEPTVSGEHDLMRVLDLSRHFAIPTAVCVNKWDINPRMTERIERIARDNSCLLAGRIPYDLSVTEAQVRKLTVVEVESPAADAVRSIWKQLRQPQFSC